MYILGIIIAIVEIFAGIATLFSSQGEWLIIVVGISYILSGMLFVWLCSGANQAYTNKNVVSALENDVEHLLEQKEVLEESIKKLEEKVKNLSKKESK